MRAPIAALRRFGPFLQAHGRERVDHAHDVVGADDHRSVTRPIRIVSLVVSA